ncbi:MAG: ubiquitin-like protein Pup [Arthrobacter sp.]|uniref:ubiquitin-like protein Pup n=1 Tax=unclassified Arthrobacter TaxID=235627 RepID=UPI00265394DE|nr:ubiquitin-like protein Pup [Micrococcaceae bacterium]MDN5823185.1 ubiquitin-like protein Pup [Micrococcaceae bacterium]MDN5878257.1 ubiquitin-like protein Pup [Micrococcaceae bacterium]MDN5885749.1 ubiquitin-like protein Pup [Micrococcaceae bacterium]MDN5904394.1 ubiquitin-like protein Pup [Micrococcaceae bacterium]
MAQEQQRPQPSTQEQEVEETPAPAAAAPATQEQTQGVDDLLEDIDGVLEQNAEEFVRGFVQKGGQ